MRIHRNIYYLILLIILFSSTSAIGQWKKKDVEWSPEGLTYKNYKLIHDSKKNADAKIGAVTGSKPAMDASVVNIDEKRFLRITLSNHFDYDKSWMLKSEINNSALLKHEQGHFDINEIYTRKTFQQFKNFRFTENFKQEIYSIMQAENNELIQMQQLYEKETVYGTNAEGQAKWNTIIADDLVSVPSYKGQVIEQQIPEKE
ncbi:MAG: hypothetical protein PW786_03085 [Arachidicoccus sp.]|nr:hypothetical protein [Arachidicoccus sp.]